MNNSSYFVLKETSFSNHLNNLNLNPDPRPNIHVHSFTHQPPSYTPVEFQGFIFRAGSAEYDEIESLIQNRVDGVTAVTLDQAMEVACRMSQELQELMDEAKAAGSDLSGVQALINDFDQLHKLWVNGK